MRPTRVFIHGLESSGRGTKGRFFRERYPDMIVEDYLGPFAQRMEKLEALLAERTSLVLVGSSYGGLMAAVFAGRHPQAVGKMILLAPALHLEAYRPLLPRRLSLPVIVYHGIRDTVVPLRAARAVAEAIFPDLLFEAVDDDHALHDVFPRLPWDSLLALP